MCWEGSQNFEIILQQIFAMLETTFNREKKNKMKAKSCFSLNADFNYFSELVFVDKPCRWISFFFLSVCIQAKEYWLLQMLTQHTAKIWKKIKRFNLKNKSTCSEENKRSVSRGGKCRGGRLGRIGMMFSFRPIIYFKSWPEIIQIAKNPPLR